MKQYKSQLDELSIMRQKTDFKRAKLSSSLDSADYIRQLWGSDMDIVESVFLVLLNNANNTVGYVKISSGSIAGCLVDARIVAHYAVQTLATSVIMAHNHPSGNLKPSQADKTLTDKIKSTLNIFDVRMLDHIILSPENNQYYSFADEGLL